MTRRGLRLSMALVALVALPFASGAQAITDATADAIEVLCPSTRTRVLAEQAHVLGVTEPGARLDLVNLDTGDVVAAGVAEAPAGAFRLVTPLRPFRANRLRVVAVSSNGTTIGHVDVPELVQGQEFREGILIVKFFTADAIEEVMARHGLDPEGLRSAHAGTQNPLWYYILEVEPGTEADVRDALLADPDVAIADFDFVVSMSVPGTFVEGESAANPAHPDACEIVPATLFEDPVGMAVERARRRWSRSVDYRDFVVARSDAWPDVVLARLAPLPGGGPLLLVDGGCDPPFSQALGEFLVSIFGWRNSTITPVIVGGEDVVPPCVEQALDEHYDTPVRLAGPDRCETAVEVAEARRKLRRDDPLTVVLARGTTGADAAAVAANPVAWPWGLLLTDEHSLCERAVSWLEASATEIGRLVVVGGAAAVPDAVVAQAVSAVGHPLPVERYGGATRAGTALALAQAFAPDARWVNLVPGTDPVSTMLANEPSRDPARPTLYLSDQSVDAAVLAYLDRLRPLGFVGRDGFARLFGRTPDVSAQLQVDLLRHFIEEAGP